MPLQKFDKGNVQASVYSGHKKNPSLSDLMPGPLELSLCDLKENDSALFIQFELMPVIPSPSVEDTLQTTTSNQSEDVTQSKELDLVTAVLMHRRNHYPKGRPNAKYGDKKQYDALVNFLKERKFGVKGTELPDYEDFTILLSSLLWDVDPHYKKLCERGARFPNEMQSLLGYNTPKGHDHPVKPLDIQKLNSKVTRLILQLERKYMMLSHMKPLAELVYKVCESISSYSKYLDRQKIRNAANRLRDDVPDSFNSPLDDFCVRKLKQVFSTENNSLCGLKLVLQDKDVFVPINMNDHVPVRNRHTFYELMKKVCEVGFPACDSKHDLYYYRLPSQGPHCAVHFIWKAPKSGINVEDENARLMSSLREKIKVYHTRASRKLVKETLRRIGINKPHKAEFIIRNLLGDASAPECQNQSQILERLNHYIELGEDIICDLRENNGAVPKYEQFWEIVDNYLKDKTGAEDRRHAGASNEGEVVVNIAMAASLAHIHRECEELAKQKEPAVEVPSYTWFLHQFWPTTRSKSNIAQYTGRFAVKRMVQARVLRNLNCDSH